MDLRHGHFDEALTDVDLSLARDCDECTCLSWRSTGSNDVAPHAASSSILLLPRFPLNFGTLLIFESPLFIRLMARRLKAGTGTVGGYLFIQHCL